MSFPSETSLGKAFVPWWPFFRKDPERNFIGEVIGFLLWITTTEASPRSPRTNAPPRSARCRACFDTFYSRSMFCHLWFELEYTPKDQAVFKLRGRACRRKSWGPNMTIGYKAKFDLGRACARPTRAPAGVRRPWLSLMEALKWASARGILVWVLILGWDWLNTNCK